MNLGRKSNNDLLFINFNQDNTCISVGTRSGYHIYNCDPIGRWFSKQDGAIGIVEMMFSTSLLALVGAGEQPTLSPRRLQIINTKRQSTICEIPFTSAILAVKLNRKRLVVVLEDHIYIYDISNMKLLHTIDTAPNPNALCSLAPSSENCHLAYPPMASSGNTGEIVIFDAISLQPVNIIQAHKSALSCVAFSYDGTMIATASDKGTVIRVFSVPSGDKLYQFRRGTYPARIYSISFNLSNTALCVSSATDTVHIFKLSKETIGHANSDAGNISRTTSINIPENSNNQRSTGADATSTNTESAISNSSNNTNNNNNNNNTNNSNRNNNEEGHNNHNNTGNSSGRPGHKVNQSSIDSFDSEISGPPSASTSGSNAIPSGGPSTGSGSVGRMMTPSSVYSSLKRSQLASVAAGVGAYVLPGAITGIWEPSRDFAYAKLPVGNKGQPNICCLSNTEPETLMVVTSEGKFFQYSVDPQAGGECMLLHEKSLLE